MATHFLLHYGPWEDMVSAIIILKITINNFALIRITIVPHKVYPPAPGDRPPSPAGQQAGLPVEDRGGGLYQNQAGP